MGVVDNISSRILCYSQLFTGSSDSQRPLCVCELSAIALLLHTSIIVKNKNIILYFYLYMFLIVHQDTAEYTTLSVNH